MSIYMKLQKFISSVPSERGSKLPRDSIQAGSAGLTGPTAGSPQAAMRCHSQKALLVTISDFLALSF